jgi:uncharacterized protein
MAWLAFASAALAQPQFPALSGRVVDEAALLSPTDEAALTEKLSALETKTGAQLVIVTVPDLQGYAIEEYGYRLGRAWGIGEKERDDGALLIVAPNERKVRVEVGYGLEGTLTDALASVVIQAAILPRFRAGDFSGGIAAGADEIIAIVADPARAAEWAAKSKSPVAADAEPSPELVFFILFVLIFFVLPALRSRRGFRRAGLGLPPVIIHDWGGRSNGWGGGRGGGGFSGGGGSFGGGGSSGSW